MVQTDLKIAAANTEIILDSKYDVKVTDQSTLLFRSGICLLLLVKLLTQTPTLTCLQDALVPFIIQVVYLYPFSRFLTTF